MAAITEVLKGYRTVGMVGDGINDAPAPAKFNIDFAKGIARTDKALETAYVAWMNNDARKTS